MKRRTANTGDQSQEESCNNTGEEDQKDVTKNGTKYEEKNGKSWNVVPRSALPEFLADNEYLLRGHRPQIDDYIEIAKSVFRIHTETLNIWTHLIGCIAYVFVAFYIYTRPTNEVSSQQKFWFISFFFGAIFCLGCSALYHTVLCHSEPVYKYFSKLDYVGVVVLIVGSFPPWLHYCFYCRETAKLIYLVLILSLGVICVIAVTSDKFGTPHYRPLRAGLFSALGLTGAVPGIHYTIVEGWSNTSHIFFWIALTGIFYLAGGFIYAIRVPERFAPGKFDILGQSHQIMHMCVNAGCTCCLIGMIKLANLRHNTDPNCTQVELY